MRKIRVACTFTLLLLFVKFFFRTQKPYHISKDFRGYHVEVEVLETWDDKIMNQKLKILGYSGWSIYGEEVIRCVDINKHFQAPVIKIYGNPEYVLRKDILAGAFGYEIRDSYCIVSEALAQNLFGSTDIVGEKVILNDKLYSISSVIRETRPFICVSLNEGKVEYIEIVLESRRNVDKIVNALLN